VAARLGNKALSGGGPQRCWTQDRQAKPCYMPDKQRRLSKSISVPKWLSANLHIYALASARYSGKHPLGVLRASVTAFAKRNARQSAKGFLGVAAQSVMPQGSPFNGLTSGTDPSVIMAGDVEPYPTGHMPCRPPQPIEGPHGLPPIMTNLAFFPLYRRTRKISPYPASILRDLLAALLLRLQDLILPERFLRRHLSH